MLERCSSEGLAVPVARLEEGTDRDLYRAVSRCSLKRSAAIRALESSCRGMLLMSEEKGLRGFSRLISQLVLPAADNGGSGQRSQLSQRLQLLLEMLRLFGNLQVRKSKWRKFSVLLQNGLIDLLVPVLCTSP